MRIRHTHTILGTIFCVMISAGNADAEQKIVSEVRFGVYQHDTGIIGRHKEAGVDFAFEGLSRPLTALSLIGSPRIVVGGVVNSAGKTDQLYAGLTAERNFVRSVFTRGDAFFIEGTVGGDWNDGKIDVTGTPLEEHWKSHGSHFLFRIGWGVGYRINSTWSVALSFNHISNAGLADRNEGMNDLGLRVGMRL